MYVCCIRHTQLTSALQGYLYHLCHTAEQELMNRGIEHRLMGKDEM